MQGFFKNLFSALENKVSALVVTFIPTILCALYSVFIYKDIPNNLLTLSMVFIGAISGINVIPTMISKESSNKIEGE